MSIGTKYFDRNINIPYDLYMNNCQTFVIHVANAICSDQIPDDRYISIPLHHILSYSAARLYTILMVPFLRILFRFRGCHRNVLVEFEQICGMWGYWMLPMALQQPFVLFPAMITELRKGLEDNDNNKQLPTTMRYVSVVFSSFFMFSFVLIQPMIIIWASQPWIKKYSDGNWRLQYRPIRVHTMDLSGAMKFEEMGPEEAAPKDSGDLITDNGRFPDPENMVIPPWFWAVFGVLGFILASSYWSYRLLRRLCLLLLSSHGLM